MREAFQKPRPKRDPRSVVRGLVSPAGWDEDGRVVSTCIVTDRGSPCFVLPGGAGDEVLAHLKRYVSATGLVEKRGGVHFILVESVVPTEDPHGSKEKE